jgi:hypothetical protein
MRFLQKDIINKAVTTILCVLCALFNVVSVTSKTWIDGDSTVNTLSFGVDKIANTYLWVGSANLQWQLDDVHFDFTNIYRASAFRTALLATRDEQTQSFTATIPISQPLSLVARQLWLLSNDSRSTGLSSLSRVHGMAGVEWHVLPWIQAQALAGVEQSTQLGVEATGTIAQGNLVVVPQQIDVWQVGGNGSALWQQMDAQRRNADVQAQATLSRRGEDGTELRLNSGYSQLLRQYFTGTLLSSERQVEQRTEDRFSTDVYVAYPTSSWLEIRCDASLFSNAIGRLFTRPNGVDPTTAVNRTLREVSYLVRGQALITISNLAASGSLQLYQRNEANGVVQQFALLPTELDALREQEFQRDNTTFQTKGMLEARYTFAKADTLFGEWSSWLLRYDTPSALNNDDRDELTQIANVGWARGVSPTLSFRCVVSAQQTHLVFLKAQRSALNNVNNVLRFSPSLRIRGSVVHMNPQAEVLANYTVYDYEERGTNVRSFSFRQISYRDSVSVFLTGTLGLESQVLIRYFERSTLNWQQFSESPQAGNTEYLVKALLTTSSIVGATVGLGLRVYTLEQRGIGGGISQGALINSVQFWAPETAIFYRTAGGSSIQFSGWYEFQTVRSATESRPRNLPNVLLQAKVVL